MKWTKKENMILDDDTGELQAILAEAENELRDKMIENAPEMFASISSFVNNTDKGKFKAKSTYLELKKILDKFPKYLFDEIA